MNPLKTVLLDKRLNTSELARQMYPHLNPHTGINSLSRALTTTTPLPPTTKAITGQLADDIVRALATTSAMLQFVNDKRLRKRSFATHLWPHSTVAVAEQSLRWRQQRVSVSDDERQRLREALQSLADELHQVS